MKHSQKVALVPYDQVMPQQISTSHPAPVVMESPPKDHHTVPTPFHPRDILKDRLSDLDSKMKVILEDASLTPEEKVIRYNTTLEEYLLFAEKYYNREETTLPHSNPPISVKSEVGEFVPEQDKQIIASLPISYQKKGETLMKYLREAGTSWRKGGTLLDNGQEINGTNIKDLVHFVLRHRRKKVGEPSGIATFEKLLKASNIPEDIVPWKKVFDRKRSPPPDQVIDEQHGKGRVKKWCRY